MAFAKRVFWNSEEHRLRALWRLILQLLVFGAVMIGAGIVVAVIGAGSLLVGGSLSPDQLSDPAAVQNEKNDQGTYNSVLLMQFP